MFNLGEWKTYNLVTLRFVYEQAIADNFDTIVFDTETTGLNIVKDKPFMLGISWHGNMYKKSFTVDLRNESNLNYFTNLLTLSNVKRIIAHNTTFDLHMISNAGMRESVLESLKTRYMDTMILARFYDKKVRIVEHTGKNEKPLGLGLKELAANNLDVNARLYESKISDEIKRLKKEKRKLLASILKPYKVSKTELSDAWTELMAGREPRLPVMLVDDLGHNGIQLEFAKSKWDVKVSYDEVDINLMSTYAHFDVIYTLELAEKYLKVAENERAMEFPDQAIHREMSLIWYYYKQEKIGLKVDKKYLLEAESKLSFEKNRLKNYLSKVTINYLEKKKATFNFEAVDPSSPAYTFLKTEYDKVDHIIKKGITVGQRALLAEVCIDEFGYNRKMFEMVGSINKVEVTKYTLNKENIPTAIRNAPSKQAKTFLECIDQLSLVEKRYSTYIIRYLALLKETGDGCLHDNINQVGARSGRITSNMQQVPKDSLTKFRSDEVIFTPRKLFIPRGGVYNKVVLIDFSQHELRMQAWYTMVAGSPDTNLCRAFIPYELKDPTSWTPTDLHTKLAESIFGEGDYKGKDKGKRDIAKPVNFAIMYGSTEKGLQQNPIVREAIYKVFGDGDHSDIITRSHNGFIETYPNVFAYRRWVKEKCSNIGKITNMYGRTYFAGEWGAEHKISNYLIQGTCADMVKEALYVCERYIEKKELKSRVLITIHDEIQFEIADGEEDHVKVFAYIMNNPNKFLAPTTDKFRIPFDVDVEYYDTNWSDIKGWK